MNLETALQRVNELRAKKLGGGTLTVEEVREALEALRESRTSAATAPARSKKEKAPTVDLDDLLLPGEAK